MKICPYSIQREEILARAIGPLAAELRLIDAADFISMLRFEHHGSIADLVDSAAELYFHPGTIRFGAGGDYSLDWDSMPSVTLDLEIMPRGVTVYARLMLGRDKAAISIDYINFQNASNDPDANTAFLASSLGDARLMPTRTASTL